MKVEALILQGKEGLVQGERFAVRYGCAVVVGRSRDCDLCLRVVPRYQSLTAEEKERDGAFLSVSRRHVRLTLVNSGYVEIENLGRHGTFLDDHALGEKKIVTDLREKAHTLRLGTRETFQLQWGEIEEGDAQALGKPVA